MAIDTEYITIKMIYGDLKIELYLNYTVENLKYKIIEKLNSQGIDIYFKNIVLANKNGKVEDYQLIGDIKPNKMFIMSIIPIKCPLHPPI